MKIVHIESGLGNQMLSYCEYLVLRKLHPDEDIYIENIVYDIPQCKEVINQWNGYELNRIFSIEAPNIKEIFTDVQWNRIMDYLLKSEFWDKNWNYPVYITQALRNEGINVINIRGDFEQPSAIRNVNMKEPYMPNLRERLIDTKLGEFLKRTYKNIRARHFIEGDLRHEQIFYKGKDNIFTGQWLALKFRNSGIEYVKDEIAEAFQFPEFKDEKNLKMAEILNNCNSIAIHARRGDMLGCNGYCYKYGFFRRAVSYIKKHVENPVFVFFCDPGSVEWCRENAHIFNLDYNKDKVFFVDWNKGEDSYRDMQLMAHCKHAIITNSSFGWWGAYFIDNPNKITISPKQEITTNTTIHC